MSISRKPGLLVKPPFALQAFLLEQPSASALEILFFSLSKGNNFLKAQLQFQIWYLFRVTIQKCRKPVLYRLGEENVLNLPEIDMNAAVCASSVLSVHFQGISSANVGPLRKLGASEMMLVHKGEDAIRPENKGREVGSLSSLWDRIMAPGPINQLNCYFKKTQSRFK